MKFVRVLLPVLAAFSSVLSQKVEPSFVSSSIIGKANDNVSSITNSDLVSETTPLIANGRELNAASCRKFVDEIAVDDGETTLQQWCDSLPNPCCQGQFACTTWSTVATYEVCENSCNNREACSRVANSASSGASIKLESGSCNGEDSCRQMADFATNLQTLVVGKNSCTGKDSCVAMAQEAKNLQTLIVGNDSCTELDSCSLSAYKAKYLKQLIIPDGQCNSRESCYFCGLDSYFRDTLQLTETCCAAVVEEDVFEGNNFDKACNYLDLTSNQPSISSSPSASPTTTSSSIPSVSTQPSSIPSDVKSKASKSTPSLLFLILITSFIVMNW